MVEVMENYITEISNKEDFDDIGDNDELYIEAEDGTYHIFPKAKIQADDDGITFVDTWKGIKQYDYDDVYIYWVKNSYIPKICEDEIRIMWLICGIITGIFLCGIIGA